MLHKMTPRTHAPLVGLTLLALLATAAEAAPHIKLGAPKSTRGDACKAGADAIRQATASFCP
jgi:hypothetical protein